MRGEIFSFLFYFPVFLLHGMKHAQIKVLYKEISYKQIFHKILEKRSE